MNIQTAIPTAANGQAENKRGAVQQSENEDGGFETALRNKSEGGTDQKTGTEENTKTDGLLSREIAVSARLKSIEGPATGPRPDQVGPQDPDAAADSRTPDAQADTPVLDQVEHADNATQRVQRSEHAPMSVIQNWAHRLRAIDGKAEAGPVKSPTDENIAKVRFGAPTQLPDRADLKAHAAVGQAPNGTAISAQVANAAGGEKVGAGNPERLRSAAPAAMDPATARTQIGFAPQTETADAAAKSPVVGSAGNTNPVEDAELTASKANSLSDRIVTTQKSDAPAAPSISIGSANASNQNVASVVPAPAVPVTVTPDANGKTNPATGSLLNQLEQAEVVRDLAATDRFGFVSRLSQNGGTVQVLRLQLKPAELGTVTAHMRMENGQMTVELVAEKDAAFRQLSKDMSVMQTAMRSMGIFVDEIVVSQGSSGGDTHQTAEGQQRGTSESRGEPGFGRRPGQQSNDGETAHDPGRNNSGNGDNGATSGIYI